MKLAVLAARVNVGREIHEERLIECPTGERWGEHLRVNADHDGPEAVLDELACEIRRVPLPERKQALEIQRSELLFSIGPKIRQEDVAEDHLPDTTEV